MKLFEVSLVVTPMNELATVQAVKSIADVEPAIPAIQGNAGGVSQEFLRGSLGRDSGACKIVNPFRTPKNE